MARTLKCTIMHTAHVTKKELLDAIAPWGEPYVKLAEALYNLPIDSKARVPELIRLVRFSVNIDNNPTHAMPEYVDFDVLKELSGKLYDMLEHGQCLSLYDTMRLELLRSMVETALDDTTFEEFRLDLDKWITASSGN